jgi:hypothetical protein
MRSWSSPCSGGEASSGATTAKRRRAHRTLDGVPSGSLMAGSFGSTSAAREASRSLETVLRGPRNLVEDHLLRV